MKTEYDPNADALYLRLKQDPVENTVKIDKNTIIDFNHKNEIIGIEILFVKRVPKLLKLLKQEIDL